MITADGRRFIKRYLAGQAGSIVSAISVGIGDTAATLNDTRLQFEFQRIPVLVTGYDFSADELIFKGTLDETVAGEIREIGIWTAESNGAPGSQQSFILTSFDSEDETWDVETFDVVGARIGADGLKHTPAASATSTSVLTGVSFDFENYSSQDTFILAYNPENANTANVKIRFRTDAANYYEYTITSPVAGYKFHSFLKGSASVTGTPDWSNINEIEVRTTATGGGSASVKFDGLRVEDTDAVAPEYGLVARFVLPSPITKISGIIQDIEYALPVNI
jgi:hypothetical protein